MRVLLDSGFGYFAVHPVDAPERVTSIIARLKDIDGPLQAVVWDTRAEAWRFSPGTAAFFLYDERNYNRSFALERPAAEEMARESLRVDLPSEEELRRICAEGVSRWDQEEDPDGFFP